MRWWYERSLLVEMRRNETWGMGEQSRHLVAKLSRRAEASHGDIEFECHFIDALKRFDVVRLGEIFIDDKRDGAAVFHEQLQGTGRMFATGIAENGQIGTRAIENLRQLGSLFHEYPRQRTANDGSDVFAAVLAAPDGSDDEVVGSAHALEAFESRMRIRLDEQNESVVDRHGILRGQSCAGWSNAISKKALARLIARLDHVHLPV